MPRIEGKLQIQNKILEYRTAKSITQQELADEIGITRATIVAMEKGSYNPSLELAFRLAKFFKTEINNLFSVKGMN